MAWLILVAAGCMEIVGVIILNELSKRHHKSLIVALAIAFICSFSTLKIAMLQIPMGTAYSVWSGIGTGGGTIVGMLFYKESKSVARIFFIGLIIVAVIGLKLIS
ncbi:QacE family quaternary ammonium compound efflux SMR transporter [Staphylococcus sp. 18_1_E_LY]|uniref:QacE family quaternary ammonium compound efflux SMR transporter n=1 Tax=Staphylococcus lloydii TaxID=2781774 RepID=A0A7T1B115_9STAP|nr:SMR family transporter [Staphylococcus lloydii]MBF7020423.1 QacE family quaternary ammonium compound efflux SMR transporter [Staphylococcus lloydii]MBF7028106.1 QacE family quaternary ammonium compound efflux SMR transporter [Staphylococcus lloydii]MDU9418236.1 SMR family transporter [Staphylococcus lloydii]QPM75769.1 QacE family quaternary ammonium compound efflux SMR transporter [Staphylococcus lloydii]